MSAIRQPALPLPLGTLPPVCVAETLRGDKGIVDLWYYPYHEVTDEAVLESHRLLLTSEERARHDQFRFDRDRSLFTATRALVRTVLSQYAPVPPEGWRFVSNRHGKPHIAAPPIKPMLHFNLSNTYGLVVCAVSIGCSAIGVDAEILASGAEGIDSAEAYLSSLELAALRSVPPAAQPIRFLSYWTLKESYIKARGLGMAIPLDRFSFLLDDGHIEISFDVRLRDEPSRWRFMLIEAASGHLIAVAAGLGPTALQLRAARMLPLQKS